MLLGFQKQFIDKILSGEKRQTIRAKRKYPIKVNDKLQLYTGLRTKYCNKIMDAICSSVLDIEIKSDGTIFINGILITDESYNILAVADGFKNYVEMYNWLCKNHNLKNENFTGNIICW